MFRAFIPIFFPAVCNCWNNSLCFIDCFFACIKNVIFEYYFTDRIISACFIIISYCFYVRNSSSGNIIIRRIDFKCGIILNIYMIIYYFYIIRYIYIRNYIITKRTLTKSCFCYHEFFLSNLPAVHNLFTHDA